MDENAAKHNISIDKLSRVPIYEQVIEQLENEISMGILRESDQLPSVRSLSMELSVNPNTLQKAYTELERRGISCSVPGSGRFVAVGARNIIAQSKLKYFSPLCDIVKKLKLAGVDLDEILRAVKTEYEK